ncbi:hypothetical protein L6452_34556 [Arctium lappa]|uniref:Uncharacterized protein n=1 Tax=Arctium lappa TaxID=4217 RepID=A0ACB8YK30_ARCLA|nr:hypothetical protein L6452_34556 [Arctium lappa]
MRLHRRLLSTGQHLHRRRPLSRPAPPSPATTRLASIQIEPTAAVSGLNGRFGKQAAACLNPNQSAKWIFRLFHFFRGNSIVNGISASILHGDHRHEKQPVTTGNLCRR